MRLSLRRVGLLLVLLGPASARSAPQSPVAQSSVAQSPNDPVRVTSLGNGTFRLSRGRVSRVADLRSGISGCWGRLYDRSQGQGPATQGSGSVSARVLDLARRAGHWYLVLQIDTNSRCDIQGPCGAATNTDVLWLKFTPGLALAARQATPVATCTPDTELTRGAGRRPGEGRPPALELSDGVLALESRTRHHDGTPDLLTTLRYDRRTPERGLNVHRRAAAPLP